MIPRRPRPLCAICADRIANTITDWECESGAVRTIVACFPCLSPVKDPPEEFEPVDLAERVATRPALSGRHSVHDHTLRDAIMAEVSTRGSVTGKEMQERFALTSKHERDTLTHSLSRLVQLGMLAAEWVDETNHMAGRRFRACASGPVFVDLGALPERFTVRNIDRNRQAATSKIRLWSGLGLIEQVSPKRWNAPAVWRKTARAIARAAA